jgi:hypothetical protein
MLLPNLSASKAKSDYVAGRLENNTQVFGSANYSSNIGAAPGSGI